MPGPADARGEAIGFAAVWPTSIVLEESGYRFLAI